MFDGYSIADASMPHRLDENIIIDDDVSPTTSRATTPAPEEQSLFQFQPTMDMVAELSTRFTQQTLGACGQQLATFEPATLCPPPSTDPATSTLAAPLSRRRNPSLLLSHHRQSMKRRQCVNPAHLSHISALVEEMPQDVDLQYNAAHPSTQYPSPVSPTSNPYSPTSFESTPSSSGSEDCGIDLDSLKGLERLHATKIGKAWRRGSFTDPLERKQKLVLKKVRMRKSLVRLRTPA
ncbi:MAG: hypothetical protein Q9201_003332 [Fulgogasparrea decipioides]